MIAADLGNDPGAGKIEETTPPPAVRGVVRHPTIRLRLKHRLVPSAASTTDISRSLGNSTSITLSIRIFSAFWDVLGYHHSFMILQPFSHHLCGV